MAPLLGDNREEIWGIDVTNDMGLPLRPEEHILETEGIRAFERRLPPAWTSTTPEADYGIDRDVEVFRDGHATGLMLGAQVKASAKSLNDALGISLKVSTYRYLLANPYPCMLVLYHEPSRAVYWRWVARFRVEPGESAKTITLRMTANDLWTDAAPDRIAADLGSIRSWFASDPRMPLLYRVQLSGTSWCLTRSELVARLNLGSEGALVQAVRDGAGFVVVEFADTYVEARLETDVASFRASFGVDIDLTMFADSGAVAVCIALLVARTGKFGSAAALIGSASMEAVQVLGDSVAWYVGLILGGSGDVEPLSSLLESGYVARTAESVATLDLLLDGAMLGGSQSLLLNQSAAGRLANGVESFLRRVDPALTGGVVGAQWLRAADLNFHASQYREAWRCIRMSANVNPGVERDQRWFRRCGAVAFELGRFGCSATFYMAAIECSEGPTGIEGPLADAVMRTGEYAVALEMLNAHLNSVDDPEPWWLLKAIALHELQLTDLWRDSGQAEISESLVERIESDDAKAGYDAALEAIELDFNCHAAWDRYAHEMAARGEWDRALTAFLMAIVTDPKCLNGYVGAMQLAIETGREDSLLPIIIATGVYINGEGFITDFLADVRDQVGAVPEKLAEAVDLLAEVGFAWRRQTHVLGDPGPI